MEGHDQRTGDLAAVLGNVHVHGQVHPFVLVIGVVPDDAPIDDVLRLPHPVHRLPVQFLRREPPEFGRLIRLQGQFLLLQVHGRSIGPNPARIAIHERLSVPEGIHENAHETALHRVQARVWGAGAGKGEAEDGPQDNQAAEAHRLNSRSMSRSIAGFTSFSGMNSQWPMTAGLPMTSGSMEPFSIR